MSDMGSPGRLLYSSVLLIASAVLLPVAVLSSWAEICGLSRRQLALMGVGALFLAPHFGTWIEGVQRTSIANSVVLVNLTPVWLALAVCGSAIMA